MSPNPPKCYNAPMNHKETVTIQEYSFTVLYEPAEEGGYVVTCPALPAVGTQGETLGEARAMAAHALHLLLQNLLEHGGPVPVDQAAEPQPPPIRRPPTLAS